MKSEYRIVIDRDDDPQNPRTEYEHITHMVCFHRKYDLGDKQTKFRQADYDGWDALKKAIHKANDVYVISPVYLLDHGNLVLSLTDFNDPWDSGQVGFIWINKDFLMVDGKKKISTKRLRESAEHALSADIQEYNAYLRGDVWRFEIFNQKGVSLSSCGGFYGYQAVIEEAASAFSEVAEY